MSSIDWQLWVKTLSFNWLNLFQLTSWVLADRKNKTHRSSLDRVRPGDY